MAQQGDNSKTATATERQSVVGMFDERRDALAARDALARRGYEDIDANLMPADELGPNGIERRGSIEVEDVSNHPVLPGDSAYRLAGGPLVPMPIY